MRFVPSGAVEIVFVARKKNDFNLDDFVVWSYLQKEQEYSEEQSALVNKAYRTLQKPLSRAVYMVIICLVNICFAYGSCRLYTVTPENFGRMSHTKI